jgi:hypothetical protein
MAVVIYRSGYGACHCTARRFESLYFNPPEDKKMTVDERRLRLIKWLEVITEDLRDLLLKQYIFRELQKIVEQNPRFAGVPGLFTKWMASNFAQATAVGIRRFAKPVKKGDNGISLIRFLIEVKAYPDLITRQYYIGLFEAINAPIHIGQNYFDDLAGEGEDKLPTSLIEKHIQQINDLKGAVRAVEKYVDKRIAHYDTKSPQVPTFGDLSKALATMEEVVLIYRRLLKGEGASRLLPTIQYNWMSIFQFPWLEPDDID